MGMWDSGIMVYVHKTDANGRDAGEIPMALKEGKKDGVYLVDTSSKGNPVIKNFNPASADVFREADMQDKSVLGRAAIGYVIAGPLGGVIGGLSGTGKKDAWYLEITDKDGTSMIMRIRNQGDGNAMVKRIGKHI